MSETSASSTTGAASVNVPFLLLAGVIIAVGITMVPAWFLTGSWLYFGVFIATFLVGGLLLFDRRTGADSA
jgi:hypothetical protein